MVRAVGRAALVKSDCSKGFRRHMVECYIFFGQPSCLSVARLYVGTGAALNRKQHAYMCVMNYSAPQYSNHCVYISKLHLYIPTVNKRGVRSSSLCSVHTHLFDFPPSIQSSAFCCLVRTSGSRGGVYTIMNLTLRMFGSTIIGVFVFVFCSRLLHTPVGQKFERRRID